MLQTYTLDELAAILKICNSTALLRLELRIVPSERRVL